MDILSGLKSEASKLQKKLDTLKSAIEILNGKNGVGRGKRRRLTRSARARIAKAQRARWAKARAAKKMANDRARDRDVYALPHRSSLLRTY